MVGAGILCLALKFTFQYVQSILDIELCWPVNPLKKYLYIGPLMNPNKENKKVQKTNLVKLCE